MKSFLLLLTLGIYLQTSAQVGYCNLFIYTEHGEKFFATVNGKPLNKKADITAKAEYLATDIANVEIVFENPKLGTINKRLFLQMGYEERHVIVSKNEQNKIEAVGEEWDNKILGALGVSQDEKSSSSYVIRFNNSTPIKPKTIVKVKKETVIEKNGKYHSKSESQIEIK